MANEQEEALIQLILHRPTGVSSDRWTSVLMVHVLKSVGFSVGSDRNALSICAPDMLAANRLSLDREALAAIASALGCPAQPLDVAAFLRCGASTGS